jgi:hypothetical protein
MFARNQQKGGTLNEQQNENTGHWPFKYSNPRLDHAGCMLKEVGSRKVLLLHRNDGQKEFFRGLREKGFFPQRCGQEIRAVSEVKIKKTIGGFNHVRIRERN